MAFNDLRKAVFLDRDGVINIDYGYVSNKKDFEFTKGTFKALKLFQKNDFLIFILTNQSGIARGLFSQKKYEILTEYYLKILRDQGITITDVYHCPHHPDFSKKPFNNCECRKPKPGMFLNVIKKYNISVDDSIAIGDKLDDLEAASKAGIKERFLISKNRKIINSKEESKIKVFSSLLECSTFLNNYFQS